MILGLIFILSILYLFNELYWKRKNLPPGPTPLPIFGNVLEIFKKSPGYEAYLNWARTYGPVHTYWMCDVPVVAITDYDIIKETVIKNGEKYIDRWSMKDFNKNFRGGEIGVVHSERELWKDARRFTLHTLRDFGMGKNLMEEKVMEEVEFFLERIAKEKKNVYMQAQFDLAVGSIINNILFGYRFNDENKEQFDLVRTSLRQFILVQKNFLFFISSFYPILRKFPPFKGIHYKFMHDDRNVIFGFFQQQVNIKRKTLDLTNDEEPGDFVEAYLREWEKKKGTPQEDSYFEAQLLALIFDVWTAGMETTANTLTWGICYMLNHPGVQEKIHAEIDRVIKSDRMITMADKNDLHYLNAFISETQRLANLLPQNLFRRATEDVNIAGFKIKAGTVVHPQISCVLYDEKIFPDPYAFKPERFLNEDGTYKKVEQLVPFSIGKRQCAGEGLAKVELFLFAANIFQRFKISSPTKPSMKKVPGAVATSLPYNCDFEERF